MSKSGLKNIYMQPSGMLRVQVGGAHHGNYDTEEKAISVRDAAQLEHDRMNIERKARRDLINHLQGANK